MEDTLEQINKDILAEGQLNFPKRTFILGEGDAGARIFFTGESPGPPDAEPGRPFQGPVGDMLDRMIGANGLTRNDCYITNVVKFISQGKTLTPEIFEAFLPYLLREIETVKPQIVVTLGATPAQLLLSSNEPISKLRGKFYDLYGFTIFPTFNPAYILRDPTKKREVWEDMKKVSAYLQENNLFLNP